MSEPGVSFLCVTGEPPYGEFGGFLEPFPPHGLMVIEKTRRVFLCAYARANPNRSEHVQQVARSKLSLDESSLVMPLLIGLNESPSTQDEVAHARASPEKMRNALYRAANALELEPAFMSWLRDSNTSVLLEKDLCEFADPAIGFPRNNFPLRNL